VPRAGKRRGDQPRAERDRVGEALIASRRSHTADAVVTSLATISRHRSRGGGLIPTGGVMEDAVLRPRPSRDGRLPVSRRPVGESTLSGRWVAWRSQSGGGDGVEPFGARGTPAA
jgi:hypothetical protein